MASAFVAQAAGIDAGVATLMTFTLMVTSKRHAVPGLRSSFSGTLVHSDRLAVLRSLGVDALMDSADVPERRGQLPCNGPDGTADGSEQWRR
jgi:hypothetical protein